MHQFLRHAVEAERYCVIVAIIKCMINTSIGIYNYYTKDHIINRDRYTSESKLKYLKVLFFGTLNHSTLTPRRLRPIRVANKTQTRDPLNFGPCKADWPAAFVIK